MMRDEFNLLCDHPEFLSDENYDKIEFVYNYHPCNFSKEAIASLYNEFGMIIIYDLLLRAKMAMEHEQILARARADFKSCENRLKSIEAIDLKSQEVMDQWLKEQN